MSLYDGLEVETAPIPEISPMEEDSDSPAVPQSGGGWSSMSLKLMTTQLQRNKKAMKATQQRAPKVQPSREVSNPSSGQVSY
jgi:hypothetical protein